MRIVKRTNFSSINISRKWFLREIFTTTIVGLDNVCHRNNSGLSRILLKKIVTISKRSSSAQRRALISETQISQRYPFLILNNFKSKYFWKEAFASIVQEETFVRFKDLNLYVKFGDLSLVDCLVKQIWREFHRRFSKIKPLLRVCFNRL